MKFLFLFFLIKLIVLVATEKSRRIMLTHLLESKSIAQCSNFCDQAFSQFSFFCQMELKTYVKLQKFCEHQAQLQEQVCHDICKETRITIRNELLTQKYPRNNCTELVEECKIDCVKKIFESEISCGNICRTFKQNCDIVYELVNNESKWELYFTREKTGSSLEQRRKAQKEQSEAIQQEITTDQYDQKTEL